MRLNRKVTTLLALSWLASLLVIASCASSPASPTAALAPTQAPAAPKQAAPATQAPAVPQPTAAPKVYKIGIVGPLSGPAAPWGLDQERTVTMMAEQVNSAGGVDIAGQKYTFQVISEDDGADPTKSATAANKLVLQDKVQVIVGAILPQNTSAVQTVTEANKVPLLVVSGAASNIGAKFPYTIRPASDTVPAVGLNLAYIAKLGIKKLARVAPLHIADDWPAYEDKYAKLYGLTFLNKEVIDGATQDMSAVISKLIALKPDALHSSGFADGSFGQFVKQARQLGWKGQITESSVISPEIALSVAGAANLEGVQVGAYAFDGPLAPAGLVKFRKDFIARWGQDKWDGTAANWSTIIPSLVAGMKAAGMADTAKLIDGMLSAKNVESPLGPVVYGGGNVYGTPRQIYGAGLATGTFKNGVWQPEFTMTAEQAAADQSKAWQ